MKKRIHIVVIIALLLGTHSLWALEKHTVTGRVVSPYGQTPIEGSVVTLSDGTQSVVTGQTGAFSFQLESLNGSIVVWAPGYYTQKKPVTAETLLFVMVPESKQNYSEDLLEPFGRKPLGEKSTASVNIGKKDFSKGGLFIDRVLQGMVPGLQVNEGSGMPGEGAYFNSRGLNTLIGKSSPLIVIDGVPFIPDMSESPVIGGYTSNVFSAFSASDIKNMTFLKGAEAAIYGSIGANGVLIIETDNATDLETRVSFVAQYGISENTKTMPLLNNREYKNYIGGVAQTYFDDMGDILTEFPFLKDDPDYYYNFLYNNETDWQDMILNPAFVTENLLKIKGGDAIAKYDISFGYLNQEGVVENTGLSRYNMRLNSSINISQKLDMFASMSLAYLDNKLHEQGIIPQTNPMLVSMSKSPLLSPYRKDEYNNLLPDYASIRDESGNVKLSDAVSNPLALVNTSSISNEGSDILMNMGLNYRITNDLKFSGIVGLYNNYSRSEVFVPGVSSGAIMPLEDGLAINTVRQGIRETFNMYYSINGTYSKLFNKTHAVNVLAGGQMMTIRKEFDAGEGRNTSSDFYKTLDNVNSIGRSFFGYIYKRNWMNAFLKAGYTYKQLYTVGMNVSFDGSSSTGNATAQTGIFPSVNVAAYLHNQPFLANQSFVNRLIVRAEWLKTGNSDFDSNLSDYYYRNQVFRELSGIVRANIPNTGLSWENISTLNAGIDFTGLNQRLDLTLDLYQQTATDVILAKSISPAFGIDYIYDNLATIQNSGIELGLQAYLINHPKFDWVIGGTLATNQNTVVSLGGETDKVIEFEDGTALITREGEPVYSYYGFLAERVLSSTEEAEAAGLTDFAGNPFGPGDMLFTDVNSDGKIDDGDRIIIGNPNPDFFGRLYTSIRWGRLAILANFNYCYGNEVYNGLRREFETMDDFGNQLVSVERRWQNEGQETDMPRATYGDPMGNGRFSDRWIEDGSYLKLKELTLSFDLKRGDLKMFQGGTVYITGENLFTLTEYLGFDPEFSYSYIPYKQGLDFAKVPLMRTFKIGFKLHF
ncbi:MAG: SusC/RagA family TonB-linked outer membrane protein [Prolixibacteraceae bacterium]|nr:SusC/RagA family TonB-linked outer membrane protein [Prolixibacteraceae bacterium]